MTFHDFWQNVSVTENSLFKAILFDVDGTIISCGVPMPGATELLNFLREIKTPFLFLTNDSHHSPEEKSALIRRTGIDVQPQEICTCSNVLVDYVQKNNLQGAKVFIMGEFGKPCYAEAAGLQPCRDLKQIDECQLVVAGEGYFDWHDNFQAVMNYFIRHHDRPLIVPNPDSYWPNAKTGELGIGAGAQARFIAGLLQEMQINIQLVYLGKPYQPIFDHALKKLRTDFNIPDLQPSEVVMVGDTLFSDILGARNANLTPALVMTGITTPEILAQSPRDQLPDLIFESVGRSYNNANSGG